MVHDGDALFGLLVVQKELDDKLATLKGV